MLVLAYCTSMTAVYEIRPSKVPGIFDVECRIGRKVDHWVGSVNDDEADRLVAANPAVVDHRKGEPMDTVAVAPTKKPRKPRIKGLDVFKKKFGMLATGELIELRDYLVAQLSKQREILRSELEAMEK
jgi:hypothetical protein